MLHGILVSCMGHSMSCFQKGYNLCRLGKLELECDRQQQAAIAAAIDYIKKVMLPVAGCHDGDSSM